MEEAGGANVEKNNFARKLGSSDKKTREKGLALLVLWLSCQQDVGEDELKKIWKGLFYCLWHSDKAHVQGDLINKLAGIMESLDGETSLAFFQVFLSTMRREWNGIDRLRLDKFYRLLRQFLVRVFTLLQKSKWDEGTVGRYMDALVERCLLAKDQHAALGVSLHFVDIFLAELRKFQPLSAGTLRLMLQPCYATLASAPDKTLLKRVKESVFMPLLEEAQTVVKSIEAGSEVDENSFGRHVLSLPLGARLFELAALETTPPANRKILNEIHAEYAKLDKLVAAAGIDLSTIKIAGGSNSDIEMAEVRANGPTRQSARQARKRASTMDATDVVDAGNSVPEKKKIKQITDVQIPSDNPTGSPLPNGAGSAVSDLTVLKVKKSPKDKAAKQVKSKKHERLPANDVEKSREGAGAGAGAVKADSEQTEKVVTEKRKKGKKALPETAQVSAAVSKSKSKSKKKGSKGVGEGKGSSVPAVEAGGSTEIPEQSLVVPKFGISNGGEALSGGAKSAAGDLSGVRDAETVISVSVDDSVISNLEEKFASIAAESDKEARLNNLSGSNSPTESSGRKKRKRAKTVEAMEPSSSGGPLPLPLTPIGKSNGTTLEQTPGSNSTKKKKVKFVLKNNIVWKPNNPLPPQSMRTPPSATPRGSALKQGVPAGPIRLTPARKVGSGSKRRSPSQILSITKQKSTARSPKSLSKGPRFARRVRKSPGSSL